MARPLVIEAFYPPPYHSEEAKRLHCLCPVRALWAYVGQTQSLRSTTTFSCLMVDQLWAGLFLSSALHTGWLISLHLPMCSVGRLPHQGWWLTLQGGWLHHGRCLEERPWRRCVLLVGHPPLLLPDFIGLICLPSPSHLLFSRL